MSDFQVKDDDMQNVMQMRNETVEADRTAARVKRWPLADGGRLKVGGSAADEAQFPKGLAACARSFGMRQLGADALLVALMITSCDEGKLEPAAICDAPMHLAESVCLL